MEFAELVMQRRTVRRFEDAPVEREVLEEIARLGHEFGHDGIRDVGQGDRPVVVDEDRDRR